MTKSIYSILFLFLSFLSIAQNFESVYQDRGKVFARAIEPTGNGTFKVAGTSDDGDGFNRMLPIISTIDSFGNVTNFNVLEIDEGENSAIDMISDSDNFNYTLIATSYCDLTGGFLIKSDPSGNIIWQNFLEGNSLMWYNDNSFLVCAGSSVFLIDKDGEILEQRDADASIGQLISDTEFLVASFGSYEILTYPATVPPQVFSSPYNFLNIEISPDGNIYMLHESGIVHLDENFVATDIISFEEDDWYENFEVNDEQLFVFGKTGEATFLQVYDLLGNLINNHNLEGTNLAPTDLELQDKQLIMTAYHFEAEAESSLWVKSVSIDNIINNPRTDVGVTDISVSNVVAATTTNCFFTFAHAFLDVNFKNVVITVENFSNDIITNLNVNTLLYGCPGWCTTATYHLFEFSDLSLMPGQSISLELGDLYFGQVKDEVEDQIEICFWTSAPNNIMDSDPTNNRACTMLDYTTIDMTSVNDPINDYAIEVYPNPINEDLTIEFSLVQSKNIDFRLYSILGDKLLDFPSLNSNYTTGAHEIKLPISKSNLDDGLYMLVLDIEGELLSYKINVLN